MSLFSFGNLSMIMTMMVVKVMMMRLMAMMMTLKVMIRIIFALIRMNLSSLPARLAASISPVA